MSKLAKRQLVMDTCMEGAGRVFRFLLEDSHVSEDLRERGTAAYIRLHDDALSAERRVKDNNSKMFRLQYSRNRTTVLHVIGDYITKRKLRKESLSHIDAVTKSASSYVMTYEVM